MPRKADPLDGIVFEIAKTNPKLGFYVAAIAGTAGVTFTWLAPKSVNGFGWLIGWLLLATAVVSTLGALVGLVKHAERKKRLRSQRKLQDLHDMTWKEFEELVADAYRGKGYKVQEIGGPGDGGIDLLLNKSREVVAVQCKQWRNWKVGVEQVRAFYGSMADRPDAKHGIYVTCGKYSPDARAYGARHHIELVDGDALLALIGEVNGKVNPSPLPESDQAQRLSDTPTCPTCGSAMVRRTARQGKNAGQEFWGCSAFPTCRGMRPV